MTETWGEKNLRPAVGTGGDELQLARAASTMVDGQAAVEYNRVSALREGVPSGLSLRDTADPTKRGLR